LQTAGETAKLRLAVDRRQLKANGQDLAHVTIEALDKYNVLQPNANPQVTLKIEGAGSLVGLGSGDMTSLESYAGTTRMLYQGRALAVVRAGDQPGNITLTVSTPGLPSVKLTLKTQNTKRERK